ncbi:MAG: hypothetical protein NTX16_08605 [Actinobacteria bacterium]|nr:hypothetical protein [Actinomycetota bacterium]
MTLAGTAHVVGSTDGVGPAASFNGPCGVACDAVGNVYVADTANNTVRKITPAGDVTTFVGAAAGLDSPGGVACDAVGNVYVADTWNHVIRKVTPAGVVRILAGAVGEQDYIDGSGADARFSYPSAVACDAAGNVYVADTGNNIIRKVTPAGDVGTLVGPDAGLDSPGGVACDPAGSVYVADTFNNSIRKITPAGDVSTLAGADAGLDTPGGVCLDAAGNVYVADAYNHVVRKITAAGLVSILAGAVGEQGSADGSGAGARFSYPGGVTCDASGNVCVADTANHTIRSVAEDDVAPVTTATPPLASSATSGWRNTAQTVTLTATDAGSGVAGTSYSIDGGPTLAYSGPFTVSAPGSHAVTYFSTDNGGNIGQPQTGYVNIDVAPVTTATPPLASSATSGWRNTAQTVTLTATDAGSGVAGTSYSIDDGPTLAYSGPFTVSAPGSHAVTYFSTDNGGNIEQPQTGYVNIDAAPPTTRARPARVRAGKTVTLKFSVADAAVSCGEATVKLQIVKGTRVVKTISVGSKPTNVVLAYRFKTALRKGTYTWRVLATDAAGNKAVDTLFAKLTVK